MFIDDIMAFLLIIYKMIIYPLVELFKLLRFERKIKKLKVRFPYKPRSKENNVWKKIKTKTGGFRS